MSDSDPDPDPEKRWRAIRRGPSRQSLTEASLVLIAMNIEHVIRSDDFDWYLAVPEALAPDAVGHLERYGLENQPGAPVAKAVDIDTGWFGVMGFLLVIWLLPVLEGNGVLGWNWQELGALNGSTLANGEWWRAVTALTLHADPGHLLGNSIFGAGFGLLVGRHLGSGLGWLLILLAGMVGNLLNAALRPDAFSSIGASTATFAALAIVSGFVWRRGYFQGSNWRQAFAPIFGGIAMLAFTGVGDENTDLVAHFMGFGAGLVVGLVAAGFNVQRLGQRRQQICGALALALVVWCWRLSWR